jgi:hypothetical protein
VPLKLAVMLEVAQSAENCAQMLTFRNGARRGRALPVGVLRLSAADALEVEFARQAGFERLLEALRG